MADIFRQKMKYIIILIVIILQYTFAYSQKEYLHHINCNFFDIDFNNTDLKPKTKAIQTLLDIYQNSTNPQYTFHKVYSGVISDNSGNLMLYTDGRHLFDSNHNLIYKQDEFFNFDIWGQIKEKNAQLTDSAGGELSRIIKVPGCADEYYVLYTAFSFVYNKYNNQTFLGGCGLFCYKFRYSKQMGFKLLEPPFRLGDVLNAQFSFTKAENNIDTWIVTRKLYEHKFECYLINDNGINKTPIISQINAPFPNYIDSTYYNTYLNSMQFSPNGKYFLNKYWNYTEYQLYKFKEGKVSFVRELDTCVFSKFSSNSKFIYSLGFTKEKRSNLTLVQISMDSLNMGNKYYEEKKFGLKTPSDGFYTIDVGNFSGYYNRLLYCLYDTSKKEPYISKYNISEGFNSDSSISKLSLRLNSIEILSGNDQNNFPDTEYYSDQTPIPGGYYGTEIYKERCAKDSITLAIHFELDEKDSLYEWTGPNGFNSKKRNPVLYNVSKANQGWYDLKVFDPKINCYRNFSLHLEVKDTAEVAFIQSSEYSKDRITYLKAGDSLTLFIPANNNYDKVWSTGETGDAIVVKKYGRYILKVNTDRWCENVSYIDVVEDSMVVIEAEDIDFQKQKINDLNLAPKTIRINCKSYTYDLKVYSYVNSNPDVFETNLPVLNGQSALIFKPGGFYEFDVKFKPKEKRKYFDSIVFFSNARVIDNVTYFYGEGVDSIASVEDEPQVILDITQSKHIEFFDILGRQIATYDSYEKLKEDIQNYAPPHLIKWRDEKGIYHFESIR